VLRKSYERLSGHSVLFLEDYELRFDFGPQAKIGFNAGGELAIGLSRNFDFSIDCRYFYCSKASVKIQLSLIEDTGYITPIDLAPEKIPTDLLSINPSFFRVNLGIKYKF
jgi:hypothetical protein